MNYSALCADQSNLFNNNGILSCDSWSLSGAYVSLGV